MTQQIFDAIAAFDLTTLETLLREGADPNAISSEFPSLRPLHAAIIAIDEGGPAGSLRLLLRYGADIDRPYPGLGASTPLLCALFNDQLPTARFLLEAGADPSLGSDEGESPLRKARPRPSTRAAPSRAARPWDGR